MWIWLHYVIIMRICIISMQTFWNFTCIIKLKVSSFAIRTLIINQFWAFNSFLFWVYRFSEVVSWLQQEVVRLDCFILGLLWFWWWNLLTSSSVFTLLIYSSIIQYVLLQVLSAWSTKTPEAAIKYLLNNLLFI